MHLGFLHVFLQLDSSFLFTIASYSILTFKHLFHHQGSTLSPNFCRNPRDAGEGMTSWNKETALDIWSGGRSPPRTRITSSSSWPACHQAPDPLATISMFHLFGCAGFSASNSALPSLHAVSGAGSLTATCLRCTCQQGYSVEFPMGDIHVRLVRGKRNELSPFLSMASKNSGPGN